MADDKCIRTLILNLDNTVIDTVDTNSILVASSIISKMLKSTWKDIRIHSKRDIYDKLLSRT